MAQQWLLIETFGGEGHDEPSVIAMGSVPKKMLPLATVLGRGRYLNDTMALVARAAADGQRVEVRSSDGRRQLIGDPLISFAGRVHGVYAWIGPLGEEPPRRDLAGAWYFDMTTGKIGGSDGLLDLYGVSPEDRRTERWTAEAFGRLIANADEASALAKLVRADVGTEHQATWTVRRDDGELRAANFACRAVAERADGQVQVVLRGITHDIGPAEEIPSAPRQILLAEKVIQAQVEPGKYRAIVNLRKFTLLRWLDEPMPGIAWERNAEHQPAIHPDDLPAARQMRQELGESARAEGTVRLRSTSGQWVQVAVTARLVILDEHTTAALATLSIPGGTSS